MSPLIFCCDTSQYNIIILPDAKMSMDLFRVFSQKKRILLQGLNAAFHNPANGNKRSVNTGEKRAFGSQNILPVFPLVVDCVQSHALGDLTGSDKDCFTDVGKAVLAVFCGIVLPGRSQPLLFRFSALGAASLSLSRSSPYQSSATVTPQRFSSAWRAALEPAHIPTVWQEPPP